MLKPILKKNDKFAQTFIIAVSIIVFFAITALARVKLDVSTSFNPHIFATINAVINSFVSILLLIALFAIKSGKQLLHRNLMIAAIILSCFFLLSYIAHHLLTDATRYGDLNLDNVISDSEKQAVGNSRFLYYALLFTHIPLAGIILPFILFTAYRAAVGDYEKHKKLARITWPIWFYVAVSGVLIYCMIKPYYGG